jgi:hypothetical protein
VQFPDSRILIFAKAPLPGQVKTRLIPRLGADGAAHLQGTLMERTLTQAVTSGLAPVDFWCAPSADHPAFLRLASEFGIALETQVGEDLGERMLRAADQGLRGAGSVLLIGTDCPALSAIHLRQALLWLGSGTDAVVGPAEDGGYVLLGLRRADPLLFEGVAWGGDRVLQETRYRLSELGWQWRELETLWDLDRPEDLERYLELVETD